MKNTIFFLGLCMLPISGFTQTKTKMQPDSLPSPYATKSSRNFSNVIGWNGEMPKAPKGFVVEKFADGFENPRWMYITPNGDVLVAETNSNHSLLWRRYLPASVRQRVGLLCHRRLLSPQFDRFQPSYSRIPPGGQVYAKEVAASSSFCDDLRAY